MNGQLRSKKSNILVDLSLSKTSGKTFASSANVAAMVRLVNVVEDLVRNSRSQLWFWLQVDGEAALHLGLCVKASQVYGYMILHEMGGRGEVVKNERPT